MQIENVLEEIGQFNALKCFPENKVKFINKVHTVKLLMIHPAFHVVK